MNSPLMHFTTQEHKVSRRNQADSIPNPLGFFLDKSCETASFLPKVFYTENRFSHSSARRAFSLSEFRNSLESTCKWLSSHVSKFSRKLLISKKIRKNLIFDSFHKYVRKKNIVLYYLHEGFAGHFVWLRSCGQSLVILRSWFLCLPADMNVCASLSKMRRNRISGARGRSSDWLIDFLVSLESICKWLDPRVSRFWRKLLVCEKS